MNTDPEPEDLRYAEYVLGVLDAEARAAIEREIASNPQAAARISLWQEHLLPLAADIASQVPEDGVWLRIQARIQAERRQSKRTTARARGGWWNSLRLWRSLTFSTGIAATACAIALVAVIALPRTPTAVPSAPSPAYLAAALTQAGGQVGWTVTLDVRHARMIIVPASPQTLPDGRGAELWVIPAGHKPIPVGMIARNTPTTLLFDAARVTTPGTTAVLAVSIEPPEGSPTGAVIAHGAIDTAG